MKTAATRTGEINLIKNLQILNIVRSMPENSSRARSGLRNHPAKIATIMPPMGIRN